MVQSKSRAFRQVLLDRIRSGEYPVGGRLPGLRRLATEFDIHPNTAAKVYAELCDQGVLKTVRGSGTYVVAYPSERLGPSAESELLDALDRLAVQSRRLGLARWQWRELVERAERSAYAEAAPRIWFVECNPRDTEDLAASLGALLDARVTALLTDDLTAGRPPGPKPGDLVVTTPFHRGEVERAVHGSCDVVDVGIVPTPETLVAIARMPAGARYSVVASNRPTLDRFVSLLIRYTRREPVAASLIDDPEAPTVLRDAELLFDSQSIHDQVLRHRGDLPLITLRYQIEPASVAFLKEVLRRRDDQSRLAPAAAR